MKKLLFILVISAALFSCKSTQDTAKKTDSVKEEVETKRPKPVKSTKGTYVK